MTAHGVSTPGSHANMRRFAGITACALRTPLGVSPDENWQSIVVDHCKLRRSELIPGVDEALAQRFPHRSGLHRLDRVIKIALLAASDALDKTTKPILTDTDGLFIATSKGPIQTMIRALNDPCGMSKSDAQQLTLGPAAIGYYLRQNLGAPEAVHTSVAACAGSLAAAARAYESLITGQHRRAIVVAADSSIHPLFDASFSRLGILAPADAQGNRQCRPFDPAGRGFFITEAAAAMVLEHSPVESLHVEGTWLGGDATDLLATDSDAKSLKRGIQTLAGGAGVDFVHAHATGTRHDAYELAAIATLGSTYVFSHKRFLGHSLGASGLVGLVLSAMCHRHQMTLLGDSLPYRSASLTLAQGFGGHIGAVRLGQGE